MNWTNLSVTNCPKEMRRQVYKTRCGRAVETIFTREKFKREKSMIYRNELAMAAIPRRQNGRIPKVPRPRKKKKKMSPGFEKFCRNSTITAFRFFLRHTFCWQERFYLLACFYFLVFLQVGYTFFAHMRFLLRPTTIEVYRNDIWQKLMAKGEKVPDLFICFEDALDETRLQLALQANGIKNTTGAIEFFKFLSVVNYHSLWKTPKIFIPHHNSWNKILVESARMRIIGTSKVVFTEIGMCFQCTNCSARQEKVREPHQYTRLQADSVIRHLGVVEKSTLPEWFNHIEPPSTAMRGIYPKVKTTETKSSRAVYGLTVAQRSCMFSHERKLRNWPYYHQALCMIECRANTSMSLCGCIPHFVARPDLGDNVCSVVGMICLAGYKDFILSRKLIECGCLPDCDKLEYRASIYIENDWDHRNNETGSNISERQTGVYMETKRILFGLKREVTFGTLEYLVAVGGIAGLFLNASVLSVAEFIHALIFLPTLNWCKRRFSNKT